MLGGKGCSRRPDAKWRVMGTWVKWKWIPWKWKQRLRSGKLEDEAVKSKMSWPGQSSRWGVWSWAGGWTRGHAEVQSLNHTLIPRFSVLFVPQTGKRQIFWTSGLTGRFWSIMFHVTYPKWFIPVLFALFHHLQWLVKVLLCIYVAFMSWLWHRLGKSLRFVELFPSEAL